MDCNLKKLTNFFKFFLCILEKSLKTDCSLFFQGEKPKYFLPGVLRAISCYKDSSEGGMFLSSFSRWFLINLKWHTLSPMTSPPIVLLTHYRMTSYFILALPTGYELV